jgi:hypothetical protein
MFMKYFTFINQQKKYVMNDQHADVNNVLFDLIIDCEKTARS